MNRKKIVTFIFVAFFCLSFLSTVSYSFSTMLDDNVIIIKDVTPIYDEESTVDVSLDGNSPSVLFNDKNQKVEYKVVIENVRDYDVKINTIELSTPTEEFLKYEVVGAKKDDIVNSNKTKEFLISLETIAIDGWGQNFNDELVASISFDKINSVGNVINPNTGIGDKKIVIIFWIATVSFGICMVICLKRKFIVYTIVICLLSSTAIIVNASLLIVLPIKISVAFESQNVMKPSGWKFDDKGKINNNDVSDYWYYASQIENIFISNKVDEINNYKYAFDVSSEKNGRVMAYLSLVDGNNCVVSGGAVKECYNLYLQADGLIYSNENTSFYFYNMLNLKNINNLEGLSTSNATDMRYMFYNVGHNVDNLILDLSVFDTSNVTNMSNMFYNTGFNSSDFTLNLSNFDTSKVTDMSYMFYCTGRRSTNFVFNISNFDTSNVVDMSYMFYNTGILSSNFILDLSNFDTSNVTNMNSMFYQTAMNCPTFVLNVSSFDTSKVTDMKNLFYQTGMNNTKFVLDVSSFDTSNVIDMSGMFYQTGMNSTEFALDVSNFDTSNVIDMSNMFYNVGYKSTEFVLDLSNFNTSKVIDMNNMFNSVGYSTKNLILDISELETESVINMSNMFNKTGYNTTNLILDVSNFNTENVINMSNMFNMTGYRSENFTLDVSNFDTSNVTDMSGMFNGAGRVSTNFLIDVSGFNTSNVTSMKSMFNDVGRMNYDFNLDLSGFDTSKVVDMSYMLNNVGYNSDKFNTTITIRNPNLLAYDSVFLDVAIKSGSQLIVNYTLETSGLVDQMIVTKTPNSNVIKGVQEE